MPPSTKRRPPSYVTLALPSPGSKKTRVRIAVCAETAVRTHWRLDPLTGMGWTFATISDWRVNPDPNPLVGEPITVLTYSVWLREGSPSDPVTRDAVESQADGWFEATAEQIACRSRSMRDALRAEHTLVNLARQRSVHLLRCSTCDELSDLDARGWRVRLGRETPEPICPGCG